MSGAGAPGAGAAGAPAGSYDPAAMPGGLDGEVARLEHQAALAWPEERRLLAELGLGGPALPGRVLELGCGPGSFTARLAELVPADRLTGVDHDPALLARARARVPGASFGEGSATALPFPDASFDAAVTRLVLQHLPDPAAAVAELARVVRPGGLVAAIDVDGGLWGVAEPFSPELAAAQGKVWRAQRGRGGDRMIGRRLYRLLAGAGLQQVALRPYAYHSDELGLAAFEPVLSPEALLPAVEDGTLSLAEYGAVVAGHERFRSDPDAFVLLVGLLAAGRRA